MAEPGRVMAEPGRPLSADPDAQYEGINKNGIGGLNLDVHGSKPMPDECARPSRPALMRVAAAIGKTRTHLLQTNLGAMMMMGWAAYDVQKTGAQTKRWVLNARSGRKAGAGGGAVFGRRLDAQDLSPRGA